MLTLIVILLVAKSNERERGKAGVLVVSLSIGFGKKGRHELRCTKKGGMTVGYPHPFQITQL